MVSAIAWIDCQRPSHQDAIGRGRRVEAMDGGRRAFVAQAGEAGICDHRTASHGSSDA